MGWDHIQRNSGLQAWTWTLIFKLRSENNVVAPGSTSQQVRISYSYTRTNSCSVLLVCHRSVLDVSVAPFRPPASDPVFTAVLKSKMPPTSNGSFPLRHSHVCLPFWLWISNKLQDNWRASDPLTRLNSLLSIHKSSKAFASWCHERKSASWPRCQLLNIHKKLYWSKNETIDDFEWLDLDSQSPQGIASPKLLWALLHSI